jgi:hypothetical protein
MEIWRAAAAERSRANELKRRLHVARGKSAAREKATDARLQIEKWPLEESLSLVSS